MTPGPSAAWRALLLWVTCLGVCACAESATPVDVPVGVPCGSHTDCDDGDPCTGEERCAAGRCVPGAAVACGAGRRCLAAGGAVQCVVPCPVPDAPTLHRIHQGAELHFEAAGAPVEVGVSAASDASEPAAWTTADRLRLDELGPVTVFARATTPGCVSVGRFQHRYDVVLRYDGAPGSDGSEAIARDDAAFVGWASAWVAPVEWGTDLIAAFQTPERTLGPAEGTASDVASLGNGGRITLRFDPPITDGPGPDFAVFENGFADGFAELAFVEVSSDGVTFAAFSAASLLDAAVAQYGTLDLTAISGLAGKYRAGFGVPFDLALLRFRPAVVDGRVDLHAVTHVRLVDVIGDGRATDSFGRPIYDPTPSVESAGFDLDAIGVIHSLPWPVSPPRSSPPGSARGSGVP